MKIPPAGTVLLDERGEPTGQIDGDLATLSSLFARTVKPDFAEQVAGTLAFFKHLASVGLTGVIDPAVTKLELLFGMQSYRISAGLIVGAGGMLWT